MKILHTSDWHLGQKFIQQDRKEEHAMALEWLLTTIKEQSIDVLIVAGDIFDITSPPNYARAMYFDFLKKVLNTSCQHIVIVGGNHDSPAMLNASASLLEAFNIHVVAMAKDPIDHQVIPLHNPQGELQAVIAAVPFLRERDLQYTIAGESMMDRAERLQQSIAQHYQQLAAIMDKYPSAVPKIATGHLYTSGAITHEKQDNIYLGNIENISADRFPNTFDYIALGHIHRPQKVGGNPNIRYSGSLIPLSFSELGDFKSVVLLDWTKAADQRIQLLDVPTFRRLKTIQGSYEEIVEKLTVFVSKDRKEVLTPWVEIIVDVEDFVPQLNDKIHALAEEKGVEVLRVKANYNRKNITELLASDVQLQDLTTLEVFQKKCENYGVLPEQMKELEISFAELQTWMKERQD